MTNFVVVDIETVRANDAEQAFAPFVYRLKVTKDDAAKSGLSRYTTANGGQMEKAQRLIDTKSALSPVTGRLLCIGVNEVRVFDSPALISDEGWVKMDKLGMWWKRWHFLYVTDEPTAERDALAKLEDIIYRNSPRHRLVTFNGRHFDMPFLAFRAMMNNVHLSIPTGSPYNGRDNHIDLAILLQEWSGLENLDAYSYQNFPVRLKAWIEFFGIPVVKKSIADGEIDLFKLATTGNVAAIEEYSKGDLDATSEILMMTYPILNKLIENRESRFEG